MKRMIVAISLMASVLSSCQSVPAERRNNCACLWQEPSGLTDLLSGGTKV